jgi:hypothetical protein
LQVQYRAESWTGGASLSPGFTRPNLTSSVNS